MLKSTILKLGGVVLPLAVAVAAQAADDMKLALGFVSAQMNGQTVGSYGLANIASRDSTGEFCLGYADRAPDHTFTLEQDFAQLTIAVDSGADTTLLVQGAGTIRCNDNASRQNRDALVQGGFSKGTYNVWVGAFDQEGRHRYNLTIAE
ncbi:MAG: hypothetical protein AAF821_04700 [Cyanobacteria bacterium P01_D01_bin.156]